MSTPPSSLSRAFISRILFGVTSLGAAIGVAYLLYIRQSKKNPDNEPPTPPDSSSSALSNRKKKRNSSGERNRVTFSDHHEIFCTTNTPSPPPTQISTKTKKDEIELDGNSSACSEPQAISPEPKIEVNAIKTEDSSPAAKITSPPVVEVKEEIKLPTPSPPQLTGAAEAIAAANGNGHFAQHGLTPETDYDRTGITRELQIGRDHIPGLIGRKGTNIRAIQQDSNTIITFKDDSLENGDRICQIRGQPQDVTVAESLIEKHIMVQPILTSTTMHVPHSSVGRIIGKGGESIRGIQDLSKAKVNVDTGNQFHNRGGSDAVRMVTVTLRGTEDQIEFAKQMIIEKVDEEKALRRNIDIVTQNRAPRRSAGDSSPSSSNNSSSGGSNETYTFPTRSGVLEVFVSCAYHPNDFWIQVMGRESILLDKLTEQMTESVLEPLDPQSLTVGQIIVAPFDIDGKMYRGKILRLDDATQSAEVCYVDYGDKRIISQSDIRKMQPQFLNMRFQAVQATLNLGCVGERWPDEAIVAFCDLTYCAQWQSLTARVKEYLKSGNETVVFVELFDKDLNIGNTLINRGLATPTTTPNDVLLSPPFYDNSSSNISSSNSNKKSYASVVAKEQPEHQEDEYHGSSSTSTKVGDNGHWEDGMNGN